MRLIVNVKNNERVLVEDDVRDTDKYKMLDRIAELKRLLLETDYQALKFVEGELSAVDYEDMRTQRKAWRKEINELEEKYAADSE
jgi:antirestriction protein